LIQKFALKKSALSELAEEDVKRAPIILPIPLDSIFRGPLVSLGHSIAMTLPRERQAE